MLNECEHTADGGESVNFVKVLGDPLPISQCVRPLDEALVEEVVDGGDEFVEMAGGRCL